MLFSDPWLLAVDKPAGLLSLPGLGPEQADAVAGRLVARWGPLHLVHRLDRDTSRLLLYGNARSRGLASRLRLHAARLAFDHPVSGTRIELSSPAPWLSADRLSVDQPFSSSSCAKRL